MLYVTRNVILVSYELQWVALNANVWLILKSKHTARAKSTLSALPRFIPPSASLIADCPRQN